MANDWQAIVQEVIDLQADEEIDTSPGPSLQWYPERWLGDSKVLLMSPAARGIHHHFLMLAWKGLAIEGEPIPGSIPDEEEVLFAVCQRPESWDQIWPQVRRAWKAHEGRLWNLGLCRAYIAQMKNRRRRSRSGKKAARARWSDVKTPETSDATTEESLREDGRGTFDGSVEVDGSETQGQLEPTACDSHRAPSQDDALAISSPRPDSPSPSVSVSPPDPDSLLPSRERGESRGGESDSRGELELPTEVRQLPIPQVERQAVARLLAEPDTIDTKANRARKLTDDRAARRERVHLLARLATSTARTVRAREASGASADTALDLWNAWRARRKAKVRQERQPWFSEVRALRELLDEKHSPEQILDALLAASSAGWQGFDWSWIGSEKATKGSSRPAPAAAGYLPATEDGIHV